MRRKAIEDKTEKGMLTAGSVGADGVYRLQLSERDTLLVLDLLENPPAPTPKLLAAARAFPKVVTILVGDRLPFVRAAAPILCCKTVGRPIMAAAGFQRRPASQFLEEFVHVRPHSGLYRTGSRDRLVWSATRTSIRGRAQQAA
jgi:hypothetical protein